MIASEYELDAFHRGVEMVSNLLPHADNRQAAQGPGTIAAAMSQVDTHEVGLRLRRYPIR